MQNECDRKRLSSAPSICNWLKSDTLMPFAHVCTGRHWHWANKSTSGTCQRTSPWMRGPRVYQQVDAFLLDDHCYSLSGGFNVMAHWCMSSVGLFSLPHLPVVQVKLLQCLCFKVVTLLVEFIDSPCNKGTHLNYKLNLVTSLASQATAKTHSD